MDVLAKFWRLNWRDRCLLLCAAGLLIATRFGLRLLPLRRLLPLVARVAAIRLGPATGDARAIARRGWAVAAASRGIPGATCLAQALAGQVLLGWGGCPSELRIGVERDGDAPVRAHAWLLSGGRVVIGGTDAENFAPFPTIGPRHPPGARRRSARSRRNER